MMFWSAVQEMADGHWMTAIWDAFGGVFLEGLSELAGSKFCFAGETPLRVPGGSRPIKDIRPGDYVLTAPEDNPEAPVVARMVEEVFTAHARLWHLHVNGQVIRTTREHPFYAKGRGWVGAYELKPGDLLRSDDGEWIAVEDICDSGVDEPVYNVRIAEYHTYFVGCPEWRFSVWAHNSCLGDDMRKAGVSKGKGTDDHHIVPKNHPDAEPAQDALARNNIPIDGHMNGVNLPRNSKVSRERGTLHNERGSSLNNVEYIRAVNDRISAAELRGRRTHILRELQLLKFDLLNGTMTGGRWNYYGGGIPG
jgi:hypothetical protein